MKPASVDGQVSSLETELSAHVRDVERLVAQLEVVQTRIHRLTSAATAAALHTELLVGAADAAASSDVAEHGGSLRHALSQLRITIDDLREAARVHPGRAQQLVDGRAVLDQCVEAARRRHSGVEWGVTCTANEMTFRVSGGESPFREILDGVLDAAATRARSRVDAALRLQMARAQILFEVRHDGAAFPWEMLAGDPSALRLERGADGRVPLFDCYRLVRLNGGQFLVENVSGGGGLVRLMLPYAGATFAEATVSTAAGA